MVHLQSTGPTCGNVIFRGPDGATSAVKLASLQLEHFFFFLPAALQHEAWRKASRECCRRNSEGVRNSLMFLNMRISSSYAWPVLGRTNFTVWCCSRPLGLRGCESFRPRRKLSDINASPRLVHSDSTSTHINLTIHTLRTHTRCERAPSACLATRKVKTETDVNKVECLLLCSGRCAVLEQAVHDQLL